MPGYPDSYQVLRSWQLLSLQFLSLSQDLPSVHRLQLYILWTQAGSGNCPQRDKVLHTLVPVPLARSSSLSGWSPVLLMLWLHRQRTFHKNLPVYKTRYSLCILLLFSCIAASLVLIQPHLFSFVSILSLHFIITLFFRWEKIEFLISEHEKQVFLRRTGNRQGSWKEKFQPHRVLQKWLQKADRSALRSEMAYLYNPIPAYATYSLQRFLS